MTVSALILSRIVRLVHSCPLKFTLGGEELIEKHYTVSELAGLFSVSLATIRRRIKSGELVNTPITKREYRISQSSVDEYLRKRGEEYAEAKKK